MDNSELTAAPVYEIVALLLSHLVEYQRTLEDHPLQAPNDGQADEEVRAQAVALEEWGVCIAH